MMTNVHANLSRQAADAISRDWIQPIRELGTLLEHEPMARHTTLMVGGAARWFFRPHDRASMIASMQLLPAGIAMLPLGRGSNMLISDAGFDGIVIDLGQLNRVAIDGCRLTTEAGARMSRVARQCAEHGLTGCEFMATVPGDVGGGVAMNAGCFAQQVSDTLSSIEVLLPSGEVQKITADALNIRYRHSDLPSGSLILSASFDLRTDHPEQIRERIRSMRMRRSATQPLSQPNCGSVFKNPAGDHAARLIEAAGLKGFSIGGARFSDQHANFIVNEGDASCADIVALIEHAQSLVQQQSGIELEPEVRVIADSDTSAGGGES